MNGEEVEFPQDLRIEVLIYLFRDAKEILVKGGKQPAIIKRLQEEHQPEIRIVF